MSDRDAEAGSGPDETVLVVSPGREEIFWGVLLGANVIWILAAPARRSWFGAVVLLGLCALASFRLPSVRLEADTKGVRVRNGLWTSSAPWSSVESFRVRHSDWGSSVWSGGWSVTMVVVELYDERKLRPIATVRRGRGADELND